MLVLLTSGFLTAARPVPVAAQEPEASAESGMVKLADSDIEYFSQGAGDVVVLLPGAGLSVNYLAGFAAALAADGYRAVRINPRGAGRSRGAAAGVTLHDLAADVAGVIESLGVGPVHVGGHAFGARVARMLAADRPDLVKTVMLFAAEGKILPNPDAAAAVKVILDPAAPDAEFHSAVEYLVGDPADTKMAGDILKASLAPEALPIQQEAARSVDVDDWWAPPGDAPYLVLQGSLDKATPEGNGDLLKRDLGDRCTLVSFAGAGYVPVVTEPESVAAEVVVFLQAQPRIDHAATGYSERKPTAIPDSAGLFIYSADGQKALRIYGSLRFRAVFDDRRNFHAFDLNLPQVPTGEDDFPDLNAVWTPFETRFGVDALVSIGDGRGLLARVEVDFKGTDEKFRVRHAFVRTPHWLVGKSWSSFNTLDFLPLTVDGHGAASAAGIRPPQVRYYNSFGAFRYQASLEYQTPTLVKPDFLDAEGRVIAPALAGSITFENEAALLSLAGLLKPNRVQFTGETKEAQNLLGGGLMVGAKLDFDDDNRMKVNVNGGGGILSFFADFALTDIDLIYNPALGDFENVYGGGVSFGYEHDWSKIFSSTFGGGYLGVQNKSFEENLAFNRGYKVLGNLFYRAAGVLRGLVVAAELEYAGRTNKDATTSGTFRASFLMYYDF